MNFGMMDSQYYGIGCYVRGCNDAPVLSTVHKRNGMVATCVGHDPHRHGYGVSFFGARNYPVAVAAKTGGIRPAGGAKVPAVPVAPVIPPNDGEALQVPTFTISPGAAAVIQAAADKIDAAKRPTMVEIVEASRAARPKTGAGSRSARSVAPTIAPTHSGDDIL